MRIHRPARPRALISLVPMIDVMLILLVFFMVTSTYLNLDMIPAVKPSAGTAGSPRTPAKTLMIRLGADGVPVLRGTALTADTLRAALAAAVADAPLTQVVILPSGAARTQALITVMDGAALAGVTRLRVLRLEAAQ
ncbi:ExbD/TolR family protein [Leisingera methylohalidivorans]|uniref:Biopolymer transporter ExbD n=1 Tax=Leisingera methylohalidivorans DSM 14336 TaxID=999552 RepID=V9W3T6_9RHOB|nr:biopolymer transporter ExbD [Leisingera methylohalidivorans]AHD03802.1 biopolymer transporter ExbD [Leisingera methylohalidivorans DSM 14336]